MSLADHENTELINIARVGFASLRVAPSLQERAIQHLLEWLERPVFSAYRMQILALIEAEAWSTLLDSFYQVIPFGTGGRRGRVGIGPNRFNPWTLGMSVQGHAQWLRQEFGEEEELRVVIAHDVRRFHDLGNQLVSNVPCPVDGMSSRDFAELAAEIYAAADITVILPPNGTPMSTPELSFAIREMGAHGGLNISASHNPPDDNGGKFYNSTGGQEVPPRDEQMAALVASMQNIDRMPLDRAQVVGLIKVLPEEVTEAYITANIACSRSPTARSARVVFTALHGTGRLTVLPVLQRAGFDVRLEPTQAEFDGCFPEVPFRFPNPELPGALDRAMEYAETHNAHIVMACDPDADRLGLAARRRLPGQDNTDWRVFNGNEIAALVCHYLMSRQGFSAQPLVIKTEVTSQLVSRVTRHHGGRTIGHLLVGFKYIGDALDQLEKNGRFGRLPASLEQFILGAEESHGILVTPKVRDKDAAGAALILAELASEEAEEGRTLVDTLEHIWATVGYVRNDLLSTVMRGANGREKIQKIQASLRANPPSMIGSRTITCFHDRQSEDGPFGAIGSETERASRDVLVFEMGENARVVLRPSGTEPKNKVYVELAAAPATDGSPPSPQRISQVEKECRQLGEDFVIEMLKRIDIHLPRWCLSASEILSVEHKMKLAQDVVPELERRLHTAGLDIEHTSSWLSSVLSIMGPDAADMVRPALIAWAETDHPEHLLSLPKLL